MKIAAFDSANQAQYVKIARVALREKLQLLEKIGVAARTSEENLRTVFYSHKLTKLAKAANLSLTTEQSRVAEALTSYIYWRGRYVMPIERGIDDIIPVEHEDGLVRPPDQSVSFAEAQDLIDLVLAEVKIRLYGRA